ncbi:probable serine hydrolase [Drosophila subpulchrella]|uniref:probable serine hydrolase n=1 Tax=Drosophila subpulchrella TaxID=1486046 RepID=UPI0018A17975|nr:probable serine hydrolase [Drosophila subpulchrella]XP_037719813.1 probable serine hydrolase [Drosophila subpulchrella]
MGTLSLSDFKEVRIPAPWGHISGRWYGNRTERPILAIHGWLDNLGTFDRLIPLLPDYIGVLCIDLPGHGRSSRLQPGMHYAVDDYVLIIPRVMKEYGWSKVSLMGHSLGGIVSFIYTALAPNTVDMVISLDMLLPTSLAPKEALAYVIHSMEKHLVEEDRQVESNLHEPPSYTLSEMAKVVAKGSLHSVTPEFAKHLLHRQVLKSQLYPNKFYFSRDGRVKYYNVTQMEPGFAEEMTKRIGRKPYLVIKASMSSFIGPKVEKPLAILHQNNPHFEFYEVEGTHHVHLHAAEECARYIVPFIRHHRPPALTSWSFSGKEQQLSAEEKRVQQERFFEISKNKRSKL